MQKDELTHYREELLALRERLTDEVRRTVDEVADKGAPPDELSHVPTHPADQDTEGLDRDLEAEANRERMLDAIDVALGRIGEGTYGRCADCGKDIPKSRLDVLPFSPYCVGCAEKREES